MWSTSARGWRSSGRAGDLARSVWSRPGEGRLVGVELWAEIRRLKCVEGLSQREIHRRTGVHRDTIRNALASSTPPVYGPRPPGPSKLGPFVATIEALLAEGPTLSGVRIREGSRSSATSAARRSSTIARVAA